jgi:orotate phosphoribosyltransferase
MYVMQFNQQEFNQFVLKNNVVGFFKEPIKLKSGRVSNWYVNWRNVAEDVYLLDKLTDYVIAFVKKIGLRPDCFYGVPEGATKLGIITQYKLAKQSPNYDIGSHTLPMGRAKPKDHGTPKDKFFVGQPIGKTIVLEDVTTTGSSLLTTIGSLSRADIKVIAAISLMNRMELRDDSKSVQQVMEEKGIPYFAMSNAFELLPLAYKKMNPGRVIADAIEEEFQRYGVKKLVLEE